MSSKRRQSRVAERIKEEASNILLHELKDPRLGFVTVTHARVSPDLQRASIYVSVLGNPGDERKTMAALEHAKGYVQREIAHRVAIRRAPVVSFHIDESAKRSARIADLIQQIHDEKGENEDVTHEEEEDASDPPSREE